MFTSDLVAPVIEPIATRYARDWKSIKDTRKLRGLDYQSAGRRSRRYVNPLTVAKSVSVGAAAPYTGQVATVVTWTGSVVVKNDTEPAGFNRTAFEATLKYNPS